MSCRNHTYTMALFGYGTQTRQWNIHPIEVRIAAVINCGYICHNRGVLNHQPHGCLLSRLFRRRSKKTSKHRVTGLCVGNSPGPVNAAHKGPVMRKIFPFDDVIMPCDKHN